MNGAPVTSLAIGILSTLLGLSVFRGTASGTGAERAFPGDATVKRDPARGTIFWLQGRNLSADLERDAPFTALQTARRHADVALAFLTAHRVAFALDDPRAELQVAATQTDDLGITHVRFQQRYAGLVVRGAELIVHLDAAGHVTLVNGRYVATPHGLATTPALGADGARKAAATAAGADPSCPGCTTALLVHVDDAGHARLAYRVLVSIRIDQAWEVFVDAAGGAILDRLPTVFTHAPSPGVLTP